MVALRAMQLRQIEDAGKLHHGSNEVKDIVTEIKKFLQNSATYQTDSITGEFVQALENIYSITKTAI